MTSKEALEDIRGILYENLEFHMDGDELIEPIQKDLERLKMLEENQILNECKHKWIFKETQRKMDKQCDYYGDCTFYFTRIDVFYCENCCEIKEIKKEAVVEMRHFSEEKAPIWWNKS